MIPFPNPYSGRKVAVLGLGRSGTAAARLLARCGANVVVLDGGEDTNLREKTAMLQGEGINVLIGSEACRYSEPCDLVVLSPGIEENAAIVTNITSRGTPVVGELELAYSLTTAPVVAVTGTNGKTTTTEILTMMLRGAGILAESCGNIGTPMSELLLGKEPELFVAEVSSFQLETIRTFRPKVALWLNLSPNHLDRYPSISEYREAKLRIFENQTSEDTAICQHGSDLPPLKARRMTFSVEDADADMTLQAGTRIVYRDRTLLDMNETRLRGPHNAANLMAAFGAGIALGADPASMALAVKEYTPPPHRCELVAEENGILWVNDSKATNLDAMEQAIRSVKGRLILLAGGKDKGFGFAPIAPLVREKVALAVLIGEMRHRIARDWDPVPSILADSLEDAVALAVKAATPGDTVLFSPGTSSFDMFRSYEERGERFRTLVLELSTHSRNPTQNTTP